MHFIRKNIYLLFFIVIFLNFTIWDYFKTEPIPWLENIGQSTFIVIFYMFIRWGLSESKRENMKRK